MEQKRTEHGRVSEWNCLDRGILIARWLSGEHHLDTLCTFFFFFKSLKSRQCSTWTHLCNLVIKTNAFIFYLPYPVDKTETTIIWNQVRPRLSLSGFEFETKHCDESRKRPGESQTHIPRNWQVFYILTPVDTKCNGFLKWLHKDFISNWLNSSWDNVSDWEWH